MGYTKNSLLHNYTGFAKAITKTKAKQQMPNNTPYSLLYAKNLHSYRCTERLLYARKKLLHAGFLWG